GSPAFAVGAAIGVDFHSRIDLAGGGGPTGSSARSGSIVVATSTGNTRRAILPLLIIRQPSMRFHLKYGRLQDSAQHRFWSTDFSSVIAPRARRKSRHSFQNDGVVASTRFLSGRRHL